MMSEAPEEAPQFPKQAPPSPDYVLGPEHLPSPDYVHGPEYPKYLVPSDDEVPIEDQPLPADASPTTLSPSYIVDSNPLEENREEDPTEYPADVEDDDDDDNDDDNDDDDDEDDEDDEEDDRGRSYRAAMIRSRVVSPSPVPSPRLRRARIPVRPQTPMSAATWALIAAIANALPSSSPPPSLITPLSSLLPQIPSPPLPLPSPTLLLPAPSSPLLLPATDRREDVPEADVPPQKRLYLTALAPRFVDTVDATPGCPMSREVGYGITDDALDDRALQRARVNTLFRDRRYHLHTAMLLERHWMSRSVCYRDRGLRTRELEPARDPNPQDGPADAKMPPKRTTPTTTTTPMTDNAIKSLIAQGVANALAEYEAYRSSRNGDDSHESGSGRRTEWSLYSILATATSRARSSEIKKLEIELWNLQVKGTDVLSYNQRFHELALMCSRMFLEESDEVEKYVGGLPDMIQGSVMAFKPKTMLDVIEFATELMD
ncbi:hypothetical protein Tco_0827560 [Tanacetum coccineum]